MATTFGSYCHWLLPCHFFVRIQRQNCTTDLVEILNEFNCYICLILFIHDTTWYHSFNRPLFRSYLQFLLPNVWLIAYRGDFAIHHQSFQSIVLILHGKEIMRVNLFSRCYYVKKIKNKPPFKKQFVYNLREVVQDCLSFLYWPASKPRGRKQLVK